MKKGNLLFDPKKAQARKKAEPIPPMQGHDPCCQYCPNKGKCLYLCSPLRWVDGNVGRKESLSSQLPANKTYSDYNAEIAHRGEQVRAQIMGIGDIRKRAIAILLENDYTIAQIAHVLKCSESTIKRHKYQKRGP